MMTQEQYHIRVQGHLSPQWSDWFEGFTIINSVDGEAVLSGIILDQSALFGLLSKISILDLPLHLPLVFDDSTGRLRVKKGKTSCSFWIPLSRFCVLFSLHSLLHKIGIYT